jgi:tellurite methyltransferase
MDKSIYWKEFYDNFDNEQPSDFCKFVIDYIKDMNIIKILDCGCGNGRDSYYFGKKYLVTGLDSSSYIPIQNENCKFLNDDFCKYNKDSYELIYSRFTFHSITNKEHKIFLESIKKPDTLLCIETRSDKGKNDKRYHGDNHYRNFTNIDYIKKILEVYGFKIEYIEENKDFAIYKDENPICIRVICKKQ